VLCQVGPWGPCSAPCGVGVRNRTVVCLDAMSGAMPAGHCPARMPADELQCNVLPCDFCSHTSCAGQARPRAQLARARLWRQPLRLLCWYKVIRIKNTYISTSSAAYAVRRLGSGARFFSTWRPFSAAVQATVHFDTICTGAPRRACARAACACASRASAAPIARFRPPARASWTRPATAAPPAWWRPAAPAAQRYAPDGVVV